MNTYITIENKKSTQKWLLEDVISMELTPLGTNILRTKTESMLTYEKGHKPHPPPVKLGRTGEIIYNLTGYFTVKYTFEK